MRFTTPLLVASSLASSVVAADTCGSQWKSYNVLLLPGRSHPPAGFYATTDHAGIWTMGAMDSICVAACDKDELCVGYIGTLDQFSKYDASLRDGGRCHYYKTANLVALPCRRGNCPNQIWGRTRDNTDKCFTKSAAAASAYCTAQLNSLVPRPVTATVSVTQTPTNTVTVTRTLPDVTSTICSTPGAAVRRWDEPVDVVVERDSPRVAAVVAGSPPRTWTTKTTSTVSQSTRLPAAAVVRPVAAAAAHANAGRAAANTGVPIPACVMQSSLSQSVIVSACSCLGATVPIPTSTVTSTITVTAAALRATATAPGGTVFVTKVATLAAFELIVRESSGGTSPVVRAPYTSDVFFLEYNLPGNPAAVFTLGADGSLRTSGDLVGAYDVTTNKRLSGKPGGGAPSQPLTGCVITGQPAELKCQFKGAPTSYYNDVGNPVGGSGISLAPDGGLKLLLRNPQYSCSVA